MNSKSMCSGSHIRRLKKRKASLTIQSPANKSIKDFSASQVEIGKHFTFDPISKRNDLAKSIRNCSIKMSKYFIQLNLIDVFWHDHCVFSFHSYRLFEKFS